MTHRTSIARLADCAPDDPLEWPAMPRSSAARLADFAPVASPESWPERHAPMFRFSPSNEGKKMNTPPYIDDTPVMLRVHADLEAEALATARAVIKTNAYLRALGKNKHHD